MMPSTSGEVKKLSSENNANALIFSQHQDKKKLNYKKLKEQLFTRLRNNQQTELEQDLLTYQLDKQDISAFFLKEGLTVLDWALVIAPTSKPLQILYKVVPAEILQNLLKDNCSFLLNSFITVESGAEKRGLYSTKRQEMQIEKLGCLMLIDFDIVFKFISDVKDLPQNIKDNFSKAVEHYKTLQSSLTSSNK